MASPVRTTVAMSGPGHKGARVRSGAGGGAARGLGAACGHTSVVVEAPDDRLLQLLSPPDRTVPPGVWVALTASERAGPESGAAGETRASKRLREDTHDSEISDERDTRRRCLANAGEIPSVCSGASWLWRTAWGTRHVRDARRGRARTDVLQLEPLEHLVVGFDRVENLPCAASGVR